MNTASSGETSFVRAGLCRHPLAAVIALALAGAPFAMAQADTLPVTSCADDGSFGTLRSVIASAHDGDVVDLTQLTCSTITLKQGMIDTGYLRRLTIDGPGRDKLTISGGGVSPMFYANYDLALRDLTIAHGHTEPSKYEHSACMDSGLGSIVIERVDITDCHSYFNPVYGVHGGGAVSASTLTMIDSTITDSSVHLVDSDGSAQGGGASVGNATLIRSTISGNAAVGQNAYLQPGGGGLWVGGNLVMVDSTVTDNTCLATNDGQDSPGGGVFVYQNATILRSLIANNSADGDGGGLFKGHLASGASATFTIQSSTVAGNSAGGTGGGLISEWPATIVNSTIAGNTSALGGAVMLTPVAIVYRTGWPDFESTIIAGNTAGAGAVYATDLASNSDLTVFGANNFIGDTDAGITLPPDTLRGDPMLLPLADNGGRSETMAPAPGSPVIDAGSNPLSFVVDQRGAGFERVYGAAADVGAYEVQPPTTPGSRMPIPSVNVTIAGNRAPQVLPVTSCADDGSPGTLRAVAALAHDGDTLDLTQLTCSTITLEQGAIPIGILGPNLLYSLTIAGPGKDALTISGNDTSAVFLLGGPSHYRYPGTITLSNLTVAHGAKYDTAACIAGFSTYLVLNKVAVTHCHSRWAGGGGGVGGGGAVSGGYVQLVDSTISDSSLAAVDRNVASGGGLWAYQATLVGSTISGNSVIAPMAYAYQGYQTSGGGVYTSGWATLIDSTISGNSVEATIDGQNAIGGGVATRLRLTVTGSTVESNIADGAGGGAFGGVLTYIPTVPNAPRTNATSTTTTTTITNSTFTGNSAALGGGFASVSSITLSNSTIAANASQYGGAVSSVSSSDSQTHYTLYLDSTIIANNTIDGAGGHAADLAITPNVNLTVVGANNLVGSADPNVTLPPDTIDSDPLLLPLADNGGPTWTMALAPDSPALDVGNNLAALTTDQRGASYARVSGAAADIGAYELQPTPDIIFRNGFDP